MLWTGHSERFFLKSKLKDDPFYKKFLNGYGDTIYSTFCIADSSFLKNRGVYAYVVERDPGARRHRVDDLAQLHALGGAAWIRLQWPVRAGANVSANHRLPADCRLRHRLCRARAAAGARHRAGQHPHPVQPVQHDGVFRRHHDPRLLIDFRVALLQEAPAPASMGPKGQSHMTSRRQFRRSVLLTAALALAALAASPAYADRCDDIA